MKVAVNVVTAQPEGIFSTWKDFKFWFIREVLHLSLDVEDQVQILDVDTIIDGPGGTKVVADVPRSTTTDCRVKYQGTVYKVTIEQ